MQEHGKLSAITIAGLQSIRTLKASALESDYFTRWSAMYARVANTDQSLAFSNDNTMLACGGANTTVLIWNVPTPKAARPGKVDQAALWGDLMGADGSNERRLTSGSKRNAFPIFRVRRTAFFSSSRAKIVCTVV